MAVLSQFVDEVDYPTAFKAFQEKSNHDAMDTYYNCIWDVTILEYLVSILFEEPKNLFDTIKNNPDFFECCV